MRELEKRGIGRPSTYAEIISKVQARDYVEKLAGGRLPAHACSASSWSTASCRAQLDFMDPNFTAKMEEELDEVEAGKLERVALLKRFYKQFREQLDTVEEGASAGTPEPEPTTDQRAADECGARRCSKRWSKNGWFLGCASYPKCKTTRDLGPDGNGRRRPVRDDRLRVRQVRQADGHQDRPLRRVPLVHRLPGVQERAARAARRPLPEVRRRHHRDPSRKKRGGKTLLRLLELQRRA